LILARSFLAHKNQKAKWVGDMPQRLENQLFTFARAQMRCGSWSKIEQPVTFLFGSALPPIRRPSSREGFLERIKACFKTKILKLGDWTAFVLAE
jgi:hypothetical protein